VNVAVRRADREPGAGVPREGPEDEFDVSPGLDVGLDAAFDEGRNVVLRFSTSPGDRSALALGVVLGG
jgi:hypothetical protein